MQNRKETAWKKNRKFGDVMGGRTSPKLTDNIFNRLHNLQAPGENEEKPIFIIDNPSRDFFFPISMDDIKEILQKLPAEHTKNITHIWLRKISKKEYEKDTKPQGEFICGSGVNLIVLYPFSRDLTMNFGKKKPGKKILNWYAHYSPELVIKNGEWKLIWTIQKIKKYYLEGLLLHEIGHHIDSMHKHFWSNSHQQKAEKFADNYAYFWGNQIRNNAK